MNGEEVAYIADAERHAFVRDDVETDALGLLAAVESKLRREERATRLDHHGAVAFVEPLRLHAVAFFRLASFQALRHRRTRARVIAATHGGHRGHTERAEHSSPC